MIGFCGGGTVSLDIADQGVTAQALGTNRLAEPA